MSLTVDVNAGAPSLGAGDGVGAGEAEVPPEAEPLGAGYLETRRARRKEAMHFYLQNNISPWHPCKAPRALTREACLSLFIAATS